jgi:hypothetical protein
MNWGNYTFNETLPTSAGDHLMAFKESFEQQQTLLKMEIESSDAYIDAEPPKLAALYVLYVKCPKLGNYRSKILSVAEFGDGRFPVDIYSHFEADKKYANVEEQAFDAIIEAILNLAPVRRKIEYLYSTSASNGHA